MRRILIVTVLASAAAAVAGCDSDRPPPEPVTRTDYRGSIEPDGPPLILPRIYTDLEPDFSLMPPARILPSDYMPAFRVERISDYTPPYIMDGGRRGGGWRSDHPTGWPPVVSPQSPATPPGIRDRR